ncbi:MAG: hypothetical protein IJU66_08825 [Oscillospiraceae bacterium]|nr:hypothetical protein [Oscillospiraceae bacterium]
MDKRGISAAVEKLRAVTGKYKLALAAVLLGAALLLIPAHGGRQEKAAETEPPAGVESRIEATLAAFDGVGRLHLTLTKANGTERWEGAVVVCEGAEDAAVRLALTQALRSLTGLGTDRITIVKGTP